MAPTSADLLPHQTQAQSSVRKIYISNLVNALHVCLLRGDVDRARRAWAILVRCREIDVKAKWHWGLLLLESASGSVPPDTYESTQLSSTFRSQGGEGREAERWLKSLRVSAKEVDKPSLLHALILHLIKHHRYRAALDELETYLSSYPYLKSGPLHTYAGLLSFYLAQHPSSRADPSQSQPSRSAANDISEAIGTGSDNDDASSTSSQSPSRPNQRPVNASMIRAARGWFVKALELDHEDAVSQEFLRLIDRPQLSDDESDGEGESQSKTGIKPKAIVDDTSSEQDEWSDLDEGSERKSDGQQGGSESDTGSF